MSMRPPISTLFPYTTLFRSGVGALLAVGSAPQVVVDDVDLVSPLREVHGGGPPEVPVASEDQDAHASVLLGCMGVRKESKLRTPRIVPRPRGGTASSGAQDRGDDLEVGHELPHGLVP